MALTSAANAARYETSAEARAAAASFKQQVEQCRSREQEIRGRLMEMGKQLDAFKARGPDVKNIDQRIAKARQELWQLSLEKGAALAEMRQGFFCTGCGRTRSDILKNDPQPAVFPHPGQQIRAATQEELDAKAKEFDDKIAASRSDFDTLRQQRDQLVKQFEAAVAQQEHATDAVRLGLLQVEVDGENAAFHMNQANAMGLSLEQSERWRAQLERERELEKEREAQRQAKLAADREKREAEQRAQEARDQARRAREAAAWAAAEAQRRQADADAARWLAAAEAARQQAADRERAAGEAEAQRKAAERAAWEAQMARQQPAHEQIREPTANGPTNLEPSDASRVLEVQEAAQHLADETASQLESIRRDLNAGANSPFSPSDPTAGPSLTPAIDTLSSLGQPQADDATQAAATESRLWQMAAEAREKFAQLQEASRNGEHALANYAVDKAPDWLLSTPLNYGPQTPLGAVKSALADVAAEPPGSAGNGLLDLVKKPVVDKLSSYAANQAVNQFVSQVLAATSGPRQPDPDIPAPIAEADRELNEAASPLSLFLRTGIGYGGTGIKGLKSYGDRVTKAFDKLFGLVTDDVTSDPSGQ